MAGGKIAWCKEERAREGFKNYFRMRQNLAYKHVLWNEPAEKERTET